MEQIDQPLEITSPGELRVLARILTPQPRPPSRRELQKALGLNSNELTSKLHRLESAGLVSWLPGKARTLATSHRFFRELK